ncbi:hypothetical protein FEM03_10835 [Phragmitibacter flavus]|uniref:Uncharacterized protein n=1 Tax=Phragmitibacter flavus TaxID=2576071 RepID=A0A5R8KER8_9BACT|nr:hypothetical protein [Phragmitibacter flavus]TLD70796.1 hypothetical protein FEM03_10835 [Phragmitibacter flavus]
MYLRFQTSISDVQSGRSTGIFVAAHEFRDSNRISVADETWLREYLSYFNQHLEIPDCLKDPGHRRAISWLKEGSKMIGRVWALKAFLEEHDIFIEVITTRDPRLVVYEYGLQVVARPRRMSPPAPARA